MSNVIAFPSCPEFIGFQVREAAGFADTWQLAKTQNKEKAEKGAGQGLGYKGRVLVGNVSQVPSDSQSPLKQKRLSNHARPYQARQGRGRPRPHGVPSALHGHEEGGSVQALRAQAVRVDHG